MEKLERYTLGKTDRLKSRKAIDELFKTGKSFTLFPLRVIYQLQDNTAPGDNMNLQAGFTVSSRHFKHATDRNRIRRLIKECYRLQKNPLSLHCDYKNNRLNIFFIYVGKETPLYELVQAKMELALKRLIQLS
ncbi:MAG: ribonuclease P protein component [Bacteroidota bacterium]